MATGWREEGEGHECGNNPRRDPVEDSAQVHVLVMRATTATWRFAGRRDLDRTLPRQEWVVGQDVGAAGRHTRSTEVVTWPCH